MEYDFDFLVIGGGSAGYAAARTAHSMGKKVAVADNGAELGGLCILRGCMPSKTLIYSAEVLHLAQKGKLFGLDIDSAKVDMKALHDRKKKVIKEFSDYRQEQLVDGRFKLFQEKASFTGSNTVKLEKSAKEISAEKILISTGSYINTPPIKGMDHSDIWTSDHVLELDECPESCIVLGGGIIACELAQFLSRVGSKVTQVQRSPHILKECSTQASEVIQQAFTDEGIDVITGTALKEVRKEADEFVVSFEHEGKAKEVRAKHLINALGRKPATNSISLDTAEVELLKSGHIKTDEFQQTTNPSIYAAGDCAGPFEIVHVAIFQGENAANHAFGNKVEAINYDHINVIRFTDPQVADCGISEEECKKRGIEIVSADYPFDDHGKSILMEAKYGYVKAWADKATGKLLGAECVGKDGGELIHSMAVAISLEANVKQLMKTHWYHPTLSEIWSYPIEDLVDEIEGN